MGITDSKKWHYLDVKKLFTLLRGIKSKNNEDFCCINCFHSFRTEKVCGNHNYCYVEMPKEDNKLLKYNNGEKSMKVPFIIYADLESLLEKMNTCPNDPKNLSTTKINKHTTSGYSLFAHCSFDATKNRLDYYRGKNCMTNFCLGLREHATNIINYEKKK